MLAVPGICVYISLSLLILHCCLTYPVSSICLLGLNIPIGCSRFFTPSPSYPMKKATPTFLLCTSVVLGSNSTFFKSNYYYMHAEKAMAPHSSPLAWKIPWMEEPGRLQSMGSLRVGYDSATSFSLFTFIIGEGNGNPLQCSCLENPRDRGAWWAAVCGVAQSWTRLKQLSSSSSICMSSPSYRLQRP